MSVRGIFGAAGQPFFQGSLIYHHTCSQTSLPKDHLAPCCPAWHGSLLENKTDESKAIITLSLPFLPSSIRAGGTDV